MQPIYIDQVHDYDYTFKNNVHTLYYSYGEQWNKDVRGKVALKIKDDKNGLKIPHLKKNVSYSQALYLHTLLRIIDRGRKFEIGSKEPL